jgi:ABC-type nitrate/sulfonate/bicarbonate transport system permease component
MRSVWFSGRPSRLFLSHDFHKHAWSSIRRWLIGFGLASVIGVVGGALLASFRRLNWMFQPLIRLGQSTPSIMLIPLAIVLFGINDKMTVSVIVYGSVWPVLFNTIDGIANIDPLTINSARALRLRRFSMLRIVTLRAASPQILAGLRVALGVSIILIVASELYASSSGIGYYITYSQRSLQFTNMFAGIGLAALIGIVANGLFFLVERRLLRWRPDNRGDRN